MAIDFPPQIEIIQNTADTAPFVRIEITGNKTLVTFNWDVIEAEAKKSMPSGNELEKWKLAKALLATRGNEGSITLFNGNLPTPGIFVPN